MTQNETASILNYLLADCGQQIEKHQFEQKLKVWFDQFSHLPVGLCKAAAKIYLQRGIKFLPSIGEFSKILSEIQARALNVPDADEAFKLASDAIRQFGYSREIEAMKSLPEAVRRAAGTIGWREMCMSENAPALRAHFRQAYESIASRMTKNAGMSPKLQKLLGSEPSTKLLEVA